jgi:hypothetical protein
MPMIEDKPFNFMTSLLLTEDIYVSIYKTKIDSEVPKYNLKFFIKLIIASIIASVSFLSIYTSIIGVIIILLYLIIFFEQKLLPFFQKYRFRNRKYLQEEIVYTVNLDEIKLQSETLNVKLTWDSLYNWHKRGNWLILTFYDAPTVHLPIDKMIESKVYDQILILAQQHGKEYK